jgi:DNA-directed RNA polymerase beta' subunit
VVYIKRIRLNINKSMDSLSINSVSFSRWSSASILRSSVIAVEKESDLSSPLLGVVFGGQCPTCFQNKHACPGHFGSIRLTEPVYHISWISHLLRKLKKFKGKFQWDKHRSSILKNGELFPASSMFGVMSDPPVIAVLPVTPPHVRPPLFVDGELKGENDLTYRLQNILRKNRHLEKVTRCKRPKEIVDQAREALQNAVTGYINHEKLGPSRRTRNKREYASCESRITKKGGRIRSNLMGKRANFTGRCVITGDDGLKLTEVGIPRSVARTLTIPVKVSDYTRDALQDMVNDGNVKYVTKKDGSRSSKRVNVEVGDTVERYLVDGDIVLFNRQPSLHKYSLMAHHVKILP